eukprot:Gb_23463 [translate_table: standard]
MASETTASESPNNKSIEERMGDLRVEERDVTKPGVEGSENNKASSEEEKKSQAVEEEEEEKKVSEDVEVTEVAVRTVDHRTSAGDEGKTEDVPTTIFHEVPQEEKAKDQTPQSAGILSTVGSKVMQSVHTVKDAIIGKSNK